MKESTKTIEQFYDTFVERRNEIRERSKIYVQSSDKEIQEILSGLSDELLLENNKEYVMEIWE